MLLSCGLVNIDICRLTWALELPVRIVDDLSASEIADLETLALDGSPADAYRLVTSYRCFPGNPKKAAYWRVIAAENGHVLAQDQLCSPYTYNRPLWDRSKTVNEREPYWCGSSETAKKVTAAEASQTDTQRTRRSVERREGKPQEPLDKARMRSLQDEALAGSAEAALSLFFYHKDPSLDPEKSFYWGRISAQSGDPVGQYEFGVLLSRDVDPRNRRRARFWLKKAAENGNEEAENFLKTLPND